MKVFLIFLMALASHLATAQNKYSFNDAFEDYKGSLEYYSDTALTREILRVKLEAYGKCSLGGLMTAVTAVAETIPLISLLPKGFTYEEYSKIKAREEKQFGNNSMVLGITARTGGGVAFVWDLVVDLFDFLENLKIDRDPFAYSEYAYARTDLFLNQQIFGSEKSLCKSALKKLAFAKIEKIKRDNIK